MTNYSIRTLKDVPSVISMAVGKDSGHSIDVELSRISDGLLKDILIIGIRKIIGDTFALPAGVDNTVANKKAAALKKLDAWYAGQLNVAGGGGDSIEGEVKRLLLEHVAKARNMTVTAVAKEEPYKGRGYEVIRKIAIAKANALDAASDEQIDLAATVEQVERDLLADWIGRAKAVLEARAEAAKATAELDVADLF